MARRRDETKAGRARQLIRGGLTLRAAGAELEVNPSTIQRWTSDISRPRGPRPRADIPDDDVIHMKDKERLSFEQIAARLSLPKTTVRNRYYALTGRQRPSRSAPFRSATPRCQG